jgi:hypothetical protein
VNERQRALELLAGNSAGYTEAALVDRYGFSVALLVQLQRAGLVSARPEVMRVGRRAQRVTRIVITDAGKQALASFIDH